MRRGELQHRASLDAMPTEFVPIARAMNDAMDTFTAPIRMAAENLERISRGEIPEPVREAYAGDFDRIKVSLNRCIDAVAAIVTDGKALAHAAIEGDLATRAKAESLALDLWLID